MALTLGELSGIISMNEKPAMAALGRVRKGMDDTADKGQKTTDRMQAQVKKYEAAVASAAENVAKSRRREEDAAAKVRAAEDALAKVRGRYAADSEEVTRAQDRLATAHRRVKDAQDNTARSTRAMEAAQERLAATSQRTTQRVSLDFHKMSENVSKEGTRGGRAFTQAFVGVIGGLSAVTPAAGAAGAAMVAGAGNTVTFAASLSSLAGVAALVPAGLVAIGGGAGVLMAAFSGVGDALKEVNAAATAGPAGNPRLAAMAVEDAMMAITVAEENAAEAQENAARRVADAKRGLQEVTLAVAEAQKAAARAVEMAERDEAKAARDVITAQKDLVEAREEAAARVDKVGKKLFDAERKSVDTALAYKKAVEAYNKAKLDKKTGADQLAQLDNNVAKAMAANDDAKQAVIDLGKEHKQAQAEAKAGSEKVLAAEQKLTDARQAQAAAVQARKDAQADAIKAEAEGAQRIKDAQQAITDATKQAEKAQTDAARAVQQAHRNLERVQLQQADTAAQAGKKSAEAMGKLTPAAQESVRALLAVKEQLSGIRRIAQENFFTGFSAPLLSLAASVMPQLATGVGAIASALGAGAQIFMRALQGALDGGVLDSLLSGIAKSVTILNTAITPVVDAFTTLGVVGMGYMPRLAGLVADVAKWFNELVQKSAADGSLKAWIDSGIQGLKDLWSIAGSVVGIFKSLNQAAEAGGAVSTLGGMAEALRTIDAIMAGPVFQKTMATIFSGAEAGAQGLLAALGPIGAAFERGAPALAEFLKLGGQIAGTFIGGVFTALSNPAFGAGLVTFMQGLQRGAEAIAPLLPGLTGALGALLTAIAPVVERLGPSLIRVFTGFAEGLAKVIAFLDPLLTAIAGSPAILGVLIGAFAATTAASAALTAAGNVQRIVMAGVKTVTMATSVVQGVLAAAFSKGTTAIAANTVAMRAYGVASKIGAAAQWLMNAAMRANPIGLLITAIGALVAGLVWFFTQTELGQQIVQNVWAGIQVAIRAVVDWFQNTAMPVIQRVFAVVGAVFKWLYENVVQPVFKAIGATINWLWLNVLKPTFSAWVNVFKYVLAPAIKWLYENILKPAFEGIGSVAKWLWEKVLKPTFDAWGNVFKYVLGPLFNWLWKTIIKPAFDGIGSAIKWVWDNVLKPVFDTLNKFITKTIPDAFKDGVGFIKKHWDTIKKIASAPVEFVVNRVIRDGLIGGFNTVADFLKIGKITPPPEFKGFRDGGYTGNKPAGAVAGVVHGDEQVIKSPSRRKIERTHPGLLDHMNETGDVAGYRGGGRVAPLKELVVTQGYNRVHKGIDYAAAVGTPVFATQDGVVSHAGPGARAPGVWGGNEIHIAGNGLETWFAHLSRIGVGLGQKVRAGQQIGLSGNTGISSGPHLHFGVFNGGWPNDMDPTAYLGGAGKPSGGSAGWNPLAGIIDGLVTKFKETFPAGGAFLDMVIGVGKKILDGATKWVGDTLAGNTDKGNVAGLPPTVYDGGGWLENTGGPQIVQHNSTKPDAVLTYEELQMFKAAAKNNLAGGMNYSPTYQWMGDDPHEVMRKDKARAMDLLNALV